MILDKRIITLALLGSLVSSGAALAQQRAQQGREGGLQGDVAALAMVTGETDIDSGGSFSTSRWYLEPGASLPLGAGSQGGPGAGVGISIGFGQTVYDVEGKNGITDSITVDELSIAVPVRLPVSDTAFALIVPRISYSGEGGAALGDATTVGLLGSVAWRLSPDLVIGPGIGVYTTLEDELQALPFLLIDWAISERWSLSTGRGLAASRGPGLTLSYQASDTWGFGLIGRYEQFEFRLDDDHSTPEGTISDRAVPIVATARWTPSPQISVTGFAGYTLGGALDLYDSDGDKIGKSDYDPAPVVGLSARLTF